MLMTTTEMVPGRNIEVLGLVKGSIVSTKHIGRDIMAGFKTIVGGEIAGYTELLNESREKAISRMQKEAKALNADAVTCMRFVTCSVMNGASEVMAYGTAVKFVQ